MNRRRLLLSYLANSFSWELYSKVYFYNELVPTTINGKNVLNKAKIVKVSGNGVIENQLVNPTPPTQTINGVTFTNNGDGSWTVNGTATANTIKTVSSVFQTISGHYYLICGCANGGSNSTYRLLESYTYRWADIGSGYIQTASSSGNSSIAIEVKSGTTCNNLIFRPQFKDLTLREGTGNEPTSLTDNRIQNILNRGYIPFNLGKYKESDIGVISSQPYNLFDGELEGGSISGTNGENISPSTAPHNFRTKNFVKVFPNKSYTLEVSSSLSPAGYYLQQYDKNKNFISQITKYSNNSVFDLSSETCYVRWHFYKANSNWGISTPTQEQAQVCFHFTGTRTGYAPHQSFTPITFKAQLGGAINSHNTMEITNSAYVFTRNAIKVDMGSLEWSVSDASVGYYGANISNIDLTISYAQGILCSKYSAFENYSAFQNGDKGIFKYSNQNTIRIKDSSIANLSNREQIQNALRGSTLTYQLATPQVITIPKKHLGIVDLGSLNWTYDSTYQRFYAVVPTMKPDSEARRSKLYISDYRTLMNGEYFDATWNDVAYNGANTSTIYIHDHRYTNATDFKNALSGQLLWFETENEVADITDTIDIESGGTITTDSEVLANIELSVKCK